MTRESWPSAPRGQRGSDFQRVLELERARQAFLVFRDEADQQQAVVLHHDKIVSAGRDDACDVALPWDAKTSRLHAEFVWRAGSWMVVDDGLSRNGTFVNGERVHSRRRLREKDVVRLGDTAILFRNPPASEATLTAVAAGQLTAADVTPTQRRVLVALCRPFGDGARHAVPASNREIAVELVLSEAAIKSHMHALFERLDIKDLPQRLKRARVAELAISAGVVTPRDFERPPRTTG